MINVAECGFTTPEGPSFIFVAPSREEAGDVAQELRDEGFDAFVVPSEPHSTGWWLVTNADADILPLSWDATRAHSAGAVTPAPSVAEIKLGAEMAYEADLEVERREAK